MELVSDLDGTLFLRGTAGWEARYSRNHRNQLIRCARINDWDRFVALWKRKTDDAAWERLLVYLETLDSQKRWRVKESFARMTVEPEDRTSGEEAEAVTVALP